MRNALRRAAGAILILAAAGTALAQSLPVAAPGQVGMDPERLSRLDALMAEAIGLKDFPGAVLLVGRRGRIVVRKAYGDSEWVPRSRPMDVRMLFDMASLTKPIATATSLMVLVEQGRLRLMDKVSDFIPGFAPFLEEKGIPGADDRLWHLLTHTSGLPPYAQPADVEKALGRKGPIATPDLVAYIAGLRKESRPGEAFVYSCLNYITLAEVVRKVTGQTLDAFAAENVFAPLRMVDTMFNPPADVRARCVPTEVVDGAPLRGVVHDPLARFQGGVSGNAGLFSTADDLALFCQMMLNRGTLNGVRVLGPLAVERMTEIFPKAEPAGRGLGWDLDSDYASVRGDLFGPGSYGHSGYTGTSVWVDPETASFVIFLTNRVHPDDKGDIISMRSKVANVVAASILEK